MHSAGVSHFFGSSDFGRVVTFKPFSYLILFPNNPSPSAVRATLAFITWVTRPNNDCSNT